ncbi:MAG: hypothetical protein D6719_12825, partial [Candidatus Dadabacteria bacterium]
TGNKTGRKGRVCLITSSPQRGSLAGIIDILLPVLPWVTEAVKRAQANRIDLGFDKVPVITPEDLIIAKAFALLDSPDRFQDLDDIKELFTGVTDMDLIYLKSRLEQHKLVFPKLLKKSVPPVLKKFCR